MVDRLNDRGRVKNTPPVVERVNGWLHKWQPDMPDQAIGVFDLQRNGALMGLRDHNVYTIEIGVGSNDKRFFDLQKAIQNHPKIKALQVIGFKDDFVTPETEESVKNSVVLPYAAYQATRIAFSSREEIEKLAREHNLDISKLSHLINSLDHTSRKAQQTENELILSIQAQGGSKKFTFSQAEKSAREKSDFTDVFGEEADKLARVFLQQIDFPETTRQINAYKLSAIEAICSLDDVRLAIMAEGNFLNSSNWYGPIIYGSVKVDDVKNDMIAGVNPYPEGYLETWRSYPTLTIEDYRGLQKTPSYSNADISQKIFEEKIENKAKALTRKWVIELDKTTEPDPYDPLKVHRMKRIELMKLFAKRSVDNGQHWKWFSEEIFGVVFDEEYLLSKEFGQECALVPQTILNNPLDTSDMTLMVNFARGKFAYTLISPGMLEEATQSGEGLQSLQNWNAHKVSDNLSRYHNLLPWDLLFYGKMGTYSREDIINTLRIPYLGQMFLSNVFLPPAGPLKNAIVALSKQENSSEFFSALRDASFLSTNLDISSSQSSSRWKLIISDLKKASSEGVDTKEKLLQWFDHIEKLLQFYDVNFTQEMINSHILMLGHMIGGRKNFIVPLARKGLLIGSNMAPMLVSGKVFESDSHPQYLQLMKGENPWINKENPNSQEWKKSKPRERKRVERDKSLKPTPLQNDLVSPRIMATSVLAKERSEGEYKEPKEQFAQIFPFYGKEIFFLVRAIEKKPFLQEIPFGEYLENALKKVSTETANNVRKAIEGGNVILTSTGVYLERGRDRIQLSKILCNVEQLGEVRLTKVFRDSLSDYQVKAREEVSKKAKQQTKRLMKFEPYISIAKKLSIPYENSKIDVAIDSYSAFHCAIRGQGELQWVKDRNIVVHEDDMNDWDENILYKQKLMVLFGDDILINLKESLIRELEESEKKSPHAVYRIGESTYRVRSGYLGGKREGRGSNEDAVLLNALEADRVVSLSTYEANKQLLESTRGAFGNEAVGAYFDQAIPQAVAWQIDDRIIIPKKYDAVGKSTSLYVEPPTPRVTLVLENGAVSIAEDIPLTPAEVKSILIDASLYLGKVAETVNFQRAELEKEAKRKDDLNNAVVREMQGQFAIWEDFKVLGKYQELIDKVGIQNIKQDAKAQGEVTYTVIYRSEGGETYKIVFDRNNNECRGYRFIGNALKLDDEIKVLSSIIHELSAVGEQMMLDVESKKVPHLKLSHQIRTHRKEHDALHERLAKPGASGDVNSIHAKETRKRLKRMIVVGSPLEIAIAPQRERIDVAEVLEPLECFRTPGYNKLNDLPANAQGEVEIEIGEGRLPVVFSRDGVVLTKQTDEELNAAIEAINNNEMYKGELTKKLRFFNRSLYRLAGSNIGDVEIAGEKATLLAIGELKTGPIQFQVSKDSITVFMFQIAPDGEPIISKSYPLHEEGLGKLRFEAMRLWIRAVNERLGEMTEEEISKRTLKSGIVLLGSESGEGGGSFDAQTPFDAEVLGMHPEVEFVKALVGKFAKPTRLQSDAVPSFRAEMIAAKYLPHLLKNVVPEIDSEGKDYDDPLVINGFIAELKRIQQEKLAAEAAEKAAEKLKKGKRKKVDTGEDLPHNKENPLVKKAEHTVRMPHRNQVFALLSGIIPEGVKGDKRVDFDTFVQAITLDRILHNGDGALIAQHVDFGRDYIQYCAKELANEKGAIGRVIKDLQEAKGLPNVMDVEYREGLKLFIEKIMNIDVRNEAGLITFNAWVKHNRPHSELGRKIRQRREEGE